MAEHKLDRDYDGKTMLRTWWPKVDFNFGSIFAWLMGHFNGTADRHTAADVDYDSSTTVGQKIAQEITDRQNADNTLRTDLNSEITNRENADTEIENDIGDKNNLNTTNKTDLVSAINELAGMYKYSRETVVDGDENWNYNNYCEPGIYVFDRYSEAYGDYESEYTGTEILCVIATRMNDNQIFVQTRYYVSSVSDGNNGSNVRIRYGIDEHEGVLWGSWISSVDYDYFKKGLDAETTNRTNADSDLQSKITDEITNRQTADTTLQNNINAEVTNRQNADTEIKNIIGNKDSLQTEDKSNIVGAINEVISKLFKIDKIETIDITDEECEIEDSINIADICLDDTGVEIYRICYSPPNLDGRTDNRVALFVTTTEYFDGSMAYFQYYVSHDTKGKFRMGRHMKNGIPEWEGWQDLVDKARIGLGNVDNTSDADKPVSADQQAALNLKSNKWVATTTGYSTRYSVTLDPAPTALEVGMTITIIPHVTSTSGNVTLNVNGLGAKHICQRGLNETFTPYVESFLTANKPVTLMYDGKCWVDTTYTLPDWTDILNPPSSFTPSSHASAETTYGVGSGTNYGHLKLSSATDSTADVDGGTAATPAAAKAAYDKAVEVGNTRIWNSSGVTAANTNSWALSSYKLTMSGARNIALAYSYSYDTLVEMLGEGNLLAACGGVAEFNGATSAIIGGYGHKLNGIRSVILGGYNNIAHAYNAVCGKSCKEPTATDYNSNSGDLFVVGNGTASTRSNGFRVAANGNCYAGVAFNGTGADYNEVREWSDGNVDDDDRCGYMVAFDGIKIRLAQPGDNLRKVGIISGNSCITGNNFADYWHGKYKRDIYGRYETEPVHNDAEYDEDGNIIKEEYDGYSYVLSEDYDPSLEDEYIPRLDRSEYDLMATHGEVVVRDDGTCEADGYCIPGQDGIATKDNDEIGFYVMERVDENHVRVFVR